MNTMNSAAALSSTREDSLKKLVFAGIFAALTYIVFTLYLHSYRSRFPPLPVIK